MLGAIIGDIVGSIYEFNNIKTKYFPLFSDECFFTDDTVMTVAVYKALKKSKGRKDILAKNVIHEFKKYGKRYPDNGYGLRFKKWLISKNNEPYYSFGNGAGMRISPVVEFSNSLEDALELSDIITSVTHNHPEGIKGARAVVSAIFMAKNHKTKEEIKKFIIENYYSLDYNYNELVKNYKFNEICQETIPQAIFCFLISKDFVDCIRTTISIGGDSDTLCAISGAIAEYYYGIPEEIKIKAKKFLDKRLLKDLKKFL